MTTTPGSARPARPRPSATAPRVAFPATLVGIGLGGLVDGIVLHQILQWHHMISHEESPDTVLGLERNTLADGLFHAGAWLAVLVGVVLLWQRLGRPVESPPVRALFGWLLVGWGLFNLVEGVVNHLVLEVHHVRDDLGGPLAWDLAFLGLGALLVVGGWLLQRSAVRS